ncbi:MAG: glycosyltransferase family 4 protein [Actinomycetia bacterium]|nr:glycosyltransferase family 4 protein [Actinomycetes bacterium]
MVSYASALGGAERSLLTLATHLGVRGVNPILVCPDGPLADRALGLGLTVARSPLSAPRRVSRRRSTGKNYSPTAMAARGRNSLKDSRLLRRVAVEHGADLLHSNSLPGHLPTALAGRLARAPVVWHLREIVEPGPGREVLSLMGRLTEGMVAISDAVAASVRHPRVWTVYNPVSEPPAVVARPTWSLPKPLVGYLGRIDPSKGIEHLIVAAGLFSAEVAIVGDLDAAQPDYVASLRALAGRHAPEHVHFMGAVEEPWGALAEFDVLVVPSLAEPFGRVAAEGQRAGVVVVAAGAGGLPEIVTDGEDGLIYQPGDRVALAKSVESVLAAPALAERLRSAGKVSSERFDPSQHADAMAAIFNECVGPDSRPAPRGGR